MAQLHQESSRGTEILKRGWILPPSLSQQISTGIGDLLALTSIMYCNVTGHILTSFAPTISQAVR